jgi:hypothetical protein
MEGRMGMRDLAFRREELPAAWGSRAPGLAAWVDHWVTALDAYDVNGMTALVTPDIVWDDPAMMGETVTGHVQFRAFAEMSLRAFPDIHFDVAGDPYFDTTGTRMILPWRIAGTFTGDLAWWGSHGGRRPPPVAPTGRRVESRGLDVYAFRDGLLCHWQVVYDLFDVLGQLGLLPSPRGRLTRLGLLGQRALAPVVRRRTAAGRA